MNIVLLPGSDNVTINISTGVPQVTMVTPGLVLTMDVGLASALVGQVLVSSMLPPADWTP